MSTTNIHIDVSTREETMKAWENILLEQGIIPEEGLLNTSILSAIPIALASLEKEEQNPAKNYLLQGILVSFLKSILNQLPENALTEQQSNSLKALIEQDLELPTEEQFTDLFKRSNPNFEKDLEKMLMPTSGGGKGDKYSLQSQKANLGANKYQREQYARDVSRKAVLKELVRNKVGSFGDPEQEINKETFDRIINEFVFSEAKPKYSAFQTRGPTSLRGLLIFLLLLVGTGGVSAVKEESGSTTAMATQRPLPPPQPTSYASMSVVPSSALSTTPPSTIEKSTMEMGRNIGPVAIKNDRSIVSQLSHYASGASVFGPKPVARFNPSIGTQVGETLQNVASYFGVTPYWNPYGVAKPFITPELSSLYSEINSEYERTIKTLTRYSGGLERIPVIEYNSLHNIFTKIRVGTFKVDQTLPNMSECTPVTKTLEINRAIIDIANYDSNYNNINITIVPKVLEATWWRGPVKKMNTVDKILISYKKNTEPTKRIIQVNPIDIDAILTPFAYRMLFDENIVPDVAVLTREIDARLRLKPSRSGFWSQNTNTSRYVAGLTGANDTTRLVVSSLGQYSELQFRVAELSYADSLVNIANSVMEDPSNPVEERRGMHQQVVILQQRMNELNDGTGDIVKKAAGLLTEFQEGVTRLTNEAKDEAFWEEYRKKTTAALTKSLTDVVDGTVAITNTITGAYVGLAEAAKEIIKYTIRAEVVMMLVALFGVDIISKGSGFVGILTGEAVVQPLFSAVASVTAATAVEKGLETVSPLLHMLSGLTVYLLVVRNLRPAAGGGWWNLLTRSRAANNPAAPAPAAAPAPVVRRRRTAPAPATAPEPTVRPRFTAPAPVVRRRPTALEPATAPAPPPGPFPLSRESSINSNATELANSNGGAYRKRRTVRRRDKRSRNTRRRR